MKNPEPIPPGSRRILRGHIWLLATLIPLLEKIIPLKWLLRLLTPPSRFKPYAGTPSEEISRLVTHRLREPRNMRRRACLRQGLTLFHFLKLAGWPAVLRIGVFPPSLDSRRMHAHCWVTLNGVPLSPPPEQSAATLLVCGSADDPAAMVGGPEPGHK
ncbi:MAG: lasso peptide biosynthesis B2 protein [Verrucomicrobiota bacterium]